MNIAIEGGKSKRLLTGGKYCPEDIVVTAEGGNENALVARTLTEYVNDEVTEIGYCAFYRYEGLTSVSCAAVEYARGSSFQYCSGLKTIDLPSLCYLSSNSFMYCTGLAEVVFPAVLTVDTNSISYCTALEKVDLPCARVIQRAAFANDAALNVLILRRADDICALGNVTAFDGTPFAQGGTGGKVYVPSALIATYEAATNWSVLYGYGTCEFVSLEGSEYE